MRERSSPLAGRIVALVLFFFCASAIGAKAATGDVTVTFNKCVQGHQSQPGWEPSVTRVPALWEKLD
jgi:hypothetical protein